MSTGLPAALADALASASDGLHVIHPPRAKPGGPGGGDTDCIACSIDPLWPLHLPPEWRLCQRIDYDITGACWVLDGPDGVVLLDILVDPDGLGRLGFPTTLANRPGATLPAVVRAAYLTTKRIRKGVRDPNEWSRITALAASDPDRFEEVVAAIFGRRIGEGIASDVLGGKVPHRRGAAAARGWRRCRGPRRAVAIALAGIRRATSRLLRPLGLVVLVAGPDGVGKSTLASTLPTRCAGMFRRDLHVHWRPGLLPRPGALVGGSARPTERPHEHAPHGLIVSHLLLAYFWLDFLLDGWTRLQLLKRRTALCVVERGWWDIAVDPLRYRLRVRPGLVRFLGRALPAPDLALVLVADAAVIRYRKRELSLAEIARQQAAWRQVLPRGTRRVELAALSVDETGHAAREAVVALLEERAVAGLHRGWIAAGSDARFVVPRSPRAAARSGLSVYQPITRRARASWSLAESLAAAAVFGVLPRGAAPPRAVRAAVARYVPQGGTIATARSKDSARWTALIIAANGTAHAVAKVASHDEDAARLAVEADVLRELHKEGLPGVRLPSVLAVDDDVLVLEALRARRRSRPWQLDEDVARAAGRWAALGWVHGDFAPWNLLLTDEGWAVVDWELARRSPPGFFDLWHWLVQSYALTGRPSLSEVLAGLRGGGWIGPAITSFSDAAGVGVETAPRDLIRFLTADRARRRAMAADDPRETLLIAVEGIA